MKNKIKRLLTILMVVFMIPVFSGWSTNNIYEEADGLNYSYVSETEIDLVKDGLTDYTVIYPEGNDEPALNMAISELQVFFAQATGITLSVNTDKDYEWSEDSKVISLGYTTAYEQATEAGNEFDTENMKPTSYLLKTIGNTVFCVGGDMYGTLSAVYRFLNEQFHWETFAADEIVIDEGVKNEKLLEYDIKAVKDITWHVGGNGILRNNKTLEKRLGYNGENDFVISLYENWHNTLSVVNPNDPNVKDEWISDAGNQVCMMRDPVGLANHVIPQMQKAFLANPHGYAVGFSQEDIAVACKCDTCKSVVARYGGKDAATYILFFNLLLEGQGEVGDEDYVPSLSDWLDETFPGQEKGIYFFAYQATTSPPVKKVSSGVYEPIDNAVVCHPKIYVQYAPIYAASYHAYDTDANKSPYYEDLQGWAILTKNLMYWNYSFYYTNAGYPYFDFHDMVETMQYCDSTGAEYLFDEENSGSAQWGDFNNLKVYLKGKLGWDTSADVEMLTEKFMRNYYKQASDTMIEFFKSYSTHYSYIIENEGLRGQGAVLDIAEAELWPKELMDKWCLMFDQMYEDIEYLKDVDYALWSKLEQRICLESIQIRYLSQSVHGSCVYKGNGNTLEQDALRFGGLGVA